MKSHIQGQNRIKKIEKDIRYLNDLISFTFTSFLFSPLKNKKNIVKAGRYIAITLISVAKAENKDPEFEDLLPRRRYLDGEIPS